VGDVLARAGHPGVANPVYAYPTQLNIGLDRALPGVNVEVLNRVIGDQDVKDMAARMRADMMPRLPSLMIWQTGTKAAMHHVPLHIFERRLRERIGIGKSLGADFALMSLHTPNTFNSTVYILTILVRSASASC
jgi:acyl-CoA thioesterase-1